MALPASCSIRLRHFVFGANLNCAIFCKQLLLNILIILIMKVIGPINTLVESVPFTQLWYSLDWHPPYHISFIENIGLNPLHSDNKEMDVSKYKVTDEVIFSFPVKTKQTLWPQHCVQVC